MRAGLYSRVSTRDKGQEPANQVRQLQDLCIAQGWQLVHQYLDHESGTKSNRPQFQQMFRDAAARKFDLVVFWSLDRFTREGTLRTLKYLELLEHYGVHWRSLTEPWIDSAGPFRDVVISVLSSIAKQEQVRISERIQAGLSRARAHGTKSGRPIGRPRLVFSRDEVVALRNKGRSWGEIAKQVGISKTSARRAFETSSD
jgi:DNA invertase Pin-like site-specific DNA recombinase